MPAFEIWLAPKPTKNRGSEMMLYVHAGISSRRH
jgi:hypothetical protein